MMGRWTFGQRVGAALALMVVLTAIVALIAVSSLRSVIERKDRVIDVPSSNVALAERLYGLAQRQRAAVRDFVLLGDEQFVTELSASEVEVDDVLRQLESNGVLTVRELRQGDADYRRDIARVVATRRAGGDALALLRELSSQRARIEQITEDLVARQQDVLREERRAATEDAERAIVTLAASLAIALIVAAIAALSLSRTLSSRIGSAVQHVQSSASELQAAANQQASGSKEQATAMTEITTTISELLATSRQIAESAQRVARIAEETFTAARAGDQTVQQGGEAVGGIKRQVDGIVTHMLDLGRKSQEIGGILEIITELTDQTNILAVNAAIEAAGAGEAGRRFGVVAEEIRRLADRVATSAKEIRDLIQDVRAAVNASVMTTETASKIVDAGASHFSNVATSFQEIGELVRTTNEAAREIELSTKQQASAVEQVNRGVADVAQAAKETEVTSGQMLETVSQLARLSTDLTRLIRTERR